MHTSSFWKNHLAAAKFFVVVVCLYVVRGFEEEDSLESLPSV